ncbi:ClpXP protease specificity enhancing factor [Gammaproteobacteria bacterium]|nr:ClpXP protease specificity enhancing factor [Gammaproteobacteria bacterium]
MTPRKPYLIRALYEWIIENDHTPHILVATNLPGVIVPPKHIQNDRIILNIAPQAILYLKIENDYLSFNARFGGTPFDVQVPIGAIAAIFSQEENTEGMAFELYQIPEEAHAEPEKPVKSVFSIVEPLAAPEYLDNTEEDSVLTETKPKKKAKKASSLKVIK